MRAAAMHGGVMIRAAMLLLLAGCPSLPTAAELGEPQILALVAEPPCAPAGGSASLSALVAGPEGTIVPDRTSWSAGSGAPITVTDDQVQVAGDAASGATATVNVEVAVGDTVLRGFRSFRIGGNCANPHVADVLVDGASAMDLTARANVELDVRLDRGSASSVAWFTTAGKIDLYRQAPTKMVVDRGGGERVLFVVVRDGAGGVGTLERMVVVNGS